VHFSSNCIFFRNDASMSSEEIERTLVCQASLASQKYYGRLHLSKTSVSARLVGFDEMILIDTSKEVHLRTEDGKSCTIEPFRASTGRLITASSSIIHLDIDANQAIIGFRRWSESDRVRELHFRIENSGKFFIAPDIQSRLSLANVQDPYDSTIICVHACGIRISVFQKFYLDFQSGLNKHDGFSGKIEFDCPVLVSELTNSIGMLRTFFAAATNRIVDLTDFWIVAAEDSAEPTLQGASAPSAFELIWPTGTVERSSNAKFETHWCILNCSTENAREITQDSLKFWIENWSVWKHAFGGLISAVDAQGNYDPVRIINSCKWLESTPSAKLVKLNIKDQLAEIAASAVRKSIELGLTLDTRLSGAISQLNIESRDFWFARLIDAAAPTMTLAKKNKFRADLHLAYRMRGALAHQKFEFSDNEEFGEFVRAVSSVEALAFLLLYRALPLPSEFPMPLGRSIFLEYLLVL